MYNILQEDDSLVDMITTIGHPFPRVPHQSPPPPHTVHSALSPDEKLRSRCGLDPGHGGNGMEPGHSSTSEGGDVEYGSKPDVESSPIVRVFLRGHEGILANKPFSVHPTQMVCILYNVHVLSQAIAGCSSSRSEFSHIHIPPWCETKSIRLLPRIH